MTSSLGFVCLHRNCSRLDNMSSMASALCSRTIFCINFSFLGRFPRHFDSVRIAYRSESIACITSALLFSLKSPTITSFSNADIVRRLAVMHLVGGRVGNGDRRLDYVKPMYMWLAEGWGMVIVDWTMSSPCPFLLCAATTSKVQDRLPRRRCRKCLSGVNLYPHGDSAT
jgi:hypothetical protein